jgi:hypothetical protein
LDCGSLLPLCEGRSLLRAGRSNWTTLAAPHCTQQAAPPQSGSRLPQSKAFGAGGPPAVCFTAIQGEFRVTKSVVFSAF